MDDITKTLVHYALNLKFDDLSDKVIEEIKKRLIDSIGVAIAAYHGEPVKYAREFAINYSSNYSGTIWGTFYKSSLEYASFVNTLMIRYLDFNDTYLSKEPLHPSDMIGGILTTGEFVNASGKDILTAIALAYEVSTRFCDSGSLRIHGWDHVNYITIGTTLAVGKLLNLDEVKLCNALSVAITSHASMRQTRVGELSHWKAAATANCVKNAIFSVLITKHGITGPEKPFRGEKAFVKQLLQDDFDEKPIKELENLPKPSKVIETIIKHFPVEIHSQTAVEASQEIRKQIEIKSSQDIKKITIKTFKVAYEIIAKDSEKWDPKTRETADHSLPWITATALLNGEVWLNHYTLERIRDPEVLKLLKKIEVIIDPEIDKMYPQAIPNEIIVEHISGKTISCRINYPKGHPKNPMSIDDVIEKFNRLTKQYLLNSQRKEVINKILKLEELNNIKELIKLLII